MYEITKQNRTLAIFGKSDLDRKTDFFYRMTHIGKEKYMLCFCIHVIGKWYQIPVNVIFLILRTDEFFRAIRPGNPYPVCPELERRCIRVTVVICSVIERKKKMFGV